MISGTRTLGKLLTARVEGRARANPCPHDGFQSHSLADSAHTVVDIAVWRAGGATVEKEKTQTEYG